MNPKMLDGRVSKGKKLLLRVDINAAVVDKNPLDSARFAATAATVRMLLASGARVAILAHQGRKGEADFISLKEHAQILGRHVKKKIAYIDDLFGKRAYGAIENVKKGQAILLKNVRAYGDETDIAKKGNRYGELCRHFDLYINDAFSVSHRAHGSIVLPPRFLRSYAGPQLERELNALTHFHLANGKKTALVLGGAKIDDYIPLLKLVQHRNVTIIAGGVLGNLFLLAAGNDLGYESQWLKEQRYTSFIPKLKKLLKRYRNQIILPSDFAVGNKITQKNKVRVEKGIEQAPFKEKIWDVGHTTIRQFKQALRGVQVVFMKGPLGFSEIPLYKYGTTQLLRHISALTARKQIFSLLGGGHLTTTIEHYHLPRTFSYISMSGGALMHYLAGKKLPGLEALKNNKSA